MRKVILSIVLLSCLAALVSIGRANAEEKAKKIKKWQSKEDVRKFENCQKAADYVRNATRVGFSEPRFKGSTSKITMTVLPDGSVKAATQVRFSLDPNKSTITLPTYSWKNMSQADLDAVRKFTDAVRIHEEGHFTVAERVVKKYSTTVSATGTESEVIGKLQEAVNKKQEEAQKELDDEAGDDGAYDKVTDHGRTQENGPSKGYPGGPNVTLDCRHSSGRPFIIPRPKPSDKCHPPHPFSCTDQRTGKPGAACCDDPNQCTYGGTFCCDKRAHCKNGHIIPAPPPNDVCSCP